MLPPEEVKKGWEKTLSLVRRAIEVAEKHGDKRSVIFLRYCYRKLEEISKRDIAVTEKLWEFKKEFDKMFDEAAEKVLKELYGE